MLSPRNTIAEEPIAEIIEGELWPLLVEHREELTTNKALMELAPDVARYAEAEAAGALLGIVARIDGQVVGYSVNFVAPNLHYMRVRMAVNDVFFVDKAHRGVLGLRLMRATREAAKARGAHLMAWHAKPGTPLESILRRQGCRVQDIVFTEEL
jgi:GNAT superfamily N-acetyltransferase